MRQLIGKIVGKVLRYSKSDFRFSKDYRWGATRWNRMVYAICSTVTANYYADNKITGDDNA